MFSSFLEAPLTREQGVTMRDSIPVLALQLFCLQKPGSITQMMPSMVRDVSAIFVATTTCRRKNTNNYPRISYSVFSVFIKIYKIKLLKKNIYIRICISFCFCFILDTSIYLWLSTDFNRHAASCWPTKGMAFLTLRAPGGVGLKILACMSEGKLAQMGRTRSSDILEPSLLHLSCRSSQHASISSCNTRGHSKHQYYQYKYSLTYSNIHDPLFGINCPEIIIQIKSFSLITQLSHLKKQRRFFLERDRKRGCSLYLV